ncbi:hypothetical protein [Streptomyces sp. NPDC005301]
MLNKEHSRSYSKTPVSLPVAEALARLNGEFTGQFRTGFTRRYAWGLWGALAPLLPGHYVLEIKADTGDGFWVDTT